MIAAEANTWAYVAAAAIAAVFGGGGLAAFLTVGRQNENVFVSSARGIVVLQREYIDAQEKRIEDLESRLAASEKEVEFLRAELHALNKEFHNGEGT